MEPLLCVTPNGRQWVSKTERGPPVISEDRQRRVVTTWGLGVGGLWEPTLGSCPLAGSVIGLPGGSGISTGSILRRWKRNWFALWLDGTLGYYHDETAQDEEDRVLIRSNVRNIKIGQECHGEKKPFPL